MEKTSREYAEKLALEYQKDLGGESSSEDYANGYMKAVEETNVKGLKEILIKLRSKLQYEQGINKLNGIGKDWSLELKEINNEINKATKQ